MAFKEIPGFPGKLYIPDEVSRAEKKHDCADCYSCGWCDDDRCRLCLKGKRCDRCGEKSPGADDGGNAPEDTGRFRNGSTMNLQSKIIDDIVIIYPRGRLDFTLSMAFEKALGQIMNENRDRHFVINMREIDYINSSTLRVIAVLAQNLHKKKLKLVTCDTRGIVRRVFEITNVLDLIEIAGSEEEAVALLKSLGQS